VGAVGERVARPQAAELAAASECPTLVAAMLEAARGAGAGPVEAALHEAELPTLRVRRRRRGEESGRADAVNG
jgi:hypothetical protein